METNPRQRIVSMSKLVLLAIIISTAATSAEPLRLILVPQQLAIPHTGASTKFDAYLFNDSKTAQSVPSLETWTIVYGFRPDKTDGGSFESITRKFPRPIENHLLKAKRFDRIAIEVDIKPHDCDFVEFYIEVGSTPVIRSKPVILSCREL